LAIAKPSQLLHYDEKLDQIRVAPPLPVKLSGAPFGRSKKIIPHSHLLANFTLATYQNISLNFRDFGGGCVLFFVLNLNF
jgi:hypothetical protein